MIYSFLSCFRKKCYELKKDTKKKINLFVKIFYLENRTEKCEELEVTEGFKLGYGVLAGKIVNRTINIRSIVKARFEVSLFACIHIVTNISCTKGAIKYIQLSYGIVSAFSRFN